MAVFESRIDPGSAAFRANREDMLGLVGQLREIEGRAARLSEVMRPRDSGVPRTSMR